MPFYQGRIDRSVRFLSEAKWVAGQGDPPVWTRLPFDAKEFGPKYLDLRGDPGTWPKFIRASRLRSTASYIAQPNVSTVIACVVVRRSLAVTSWRTKEYAVAIRILQWLCCAAHELISSSISLLARKLIGLSLDWYIIGATANSSPFLSEVGDRHSQMVSTSLTPCARLSSCIAASAPEWLKLKASLARSCSKRMEALLGRDRGRPAAAAG